MNAAHGAMTIIDSGSVAPTSHSGVSVQMPNRPVDSTQSASDRPTILLIEDDAAVRESLALLLDTRGFRVLTAENGQRGLTIFRQQSPSVGVTDIMMPEQDGIGTMLQMQRERPDVKIIAISGGGRVDKADYLSIAEKLGAVAAFEKTQMNALIEMLETMLKSRP